MPLYVTPEQLRKLQGGASPAAATAPKVKAPRRLPKEEPDAGEAAQEPYRRAGWLFAQETSGLLHYAYHRTQGWRVGPAGTRRRLLEMIDEERGRPCDDKSSRP